MIIIDFHLNNTMFSNFQNQQGGEQSSFPTLFPLNTASLLQNPLALCLVIQDLYNANLQLNGQVQQLKEALEKTKKEQEGRERAECASYGSARVLQGVQVLKTPKIYKKDKICPIEGCQRRYSSKIAVNSHIRKHHLRQVKGERQGR